MLRYYKLENGPDILGEVADTEDYDLVKVLHPWLLLLSRNGGFMLQPMPVEYITINRSRYVMYEGEPEEGLVNEYRARTGKVVRAEGIQVPSFDPR